MNKNYLFFGTPHFADIILKTLIEAGFQPSVVICNPDRPVGRKKIITSPPTKIRAQENNIPVLQPANKKELTAILKTLQSYQAEFAVVAAYTHIIESIILNLPTKGTLGIHPSLLPKYRGATPIQSVLLAGETKTGVTIYKLDDEVDHGEVLAQEEINLQPKETYATLEEKLAVLGANTLVKNIAAYLDETLSLQTQNHSLATFTKKFSTADGEVFFGLENLSAIYNKIRALNPEPGTFSQNLPGYIGLRVKLLSATYKNQKLVITKIHIAGKTPQETNLIIA